jgi:16S rRNA (guanine966-N2)-methyltransferase
MPRKNPDVRRNSQQGPPRPGGRNLVRIVGGEWRGRLLRFPAVSRIRPTPDRVRETLFNWLQQKVGGSRCLDLFAGSGALGLEALSRGAAEVVFVDVEPAVIRHLAERLQEFGCDRGQVTRADAARYLEGSPRAFDLVFLDPPFDAPVLPDICRRIEQGGWLAPGGLVYLECPAAAGVPELPAGWTVLRSKRAGEVGYHLVAGRDTAGDEGDRSHG